jgi:hypothetical protein
MNLTEIFGPSQILLLTWASVSIITCVAIWVILKILDSLANIDSYIWEMCMKYPNDEELGRQIRKDAWYKKEKNEFLKNEFLSNNDSGCNI